MASGWVLITGASGGLGKAFSRRFAGEGRKLVLVARSEDVLLEEAADLTNLYGVEVLVLPCDLGDAAARADLFAEIEDRGLEVDVLVNNAGFATVGPFVDTEAGRTEQLLEVNVVALTALARAVLPQMVQRGRGVACNVASTAAFQPIEDMAVYAASKSYVLSFSSALAGEVKDAGVHVLALCPGPTETGFFDAAQAQDVLRDRRTPEQVVDSAFEAVAKRRTTVVDGLANTVMAAAAKVAPTKVAMAVSKFVTRRH